MYDSTLAAIYIHTDVDTCVYHTHTHTHIYMCISHTHIHTHTYMHIQEAQDDKATGMREALALVAGTCMIVLPPLYAPPDQFVAARILPLLLAGLTDDTKEVNTYICMYVSMHVCMCMYMCVCMYVFWQVLQTTPRR